jgi:predicted transcriptional regulator
MSNNKKKKITGWKPDEEKIESYVKSNGPCSVRRIASTLGMDRKEVISKLSDMERKGTVYFGANIKIPETV